MPISLRLALALSLLVPSAALADVVEPEPASCPPGSTPSTAHTGPYCAPTAECTSDSACSEGTCGEVMQCIETRGCGGLQPPDAEPCTLEHVVGPCASDGTCATGECRARQVCGGGGGGGGTDDGCGCRAAGAPASGGGLAWIALALGGAIALRRRR